MAKRHLTWLLGTVLAAGCLSPTLPLPPPDEPQSMGQVSDGLWNIAGSCTPGAEVIVLDEKTGRGAVFVDLERTGRYLVQIDATLCDLASVSQSSGAEDSAKTEFVVHPRQQGQPDNTSTCNP